MIKEISRKMMSWDSPVFVSHWLLAICFVGAVLTQESERFRLVHVTMGYTMMGIIAFRVGWGLIGSRYARFSTIAPRFLKVREHIQSALNGEKEALMGLSALGFVAAYLLMFLVIFVTATGYLTFNEIGPELISELHELVANLLISVVVVHVGAILLNALYQYFRRNYQEVGGRMASIAVRVRPYKWVAVILMSLVLYFWGVQFKVW